MYVAVLSSDKNRAERLGDTILDVCLSNGCYSTFLSFTADESFLKELEQKEFSTVVLSAEGDSHIELAKDIFKRRPEIKLILLGSDRDAVEGYALGAHYCAGHQPEEEDFKRIADIIFSMA